MSARDYYRAHAQLDPVFETYPNGVCVQEIELTISDHPDVPSWKALAPVICRIEARRARELAFELLELAELAERVERNPEKWL
jgi:hypothetical protein